MEPSTSTVSLLENHEHEYAIISADITSKIGKLSNHSGGKFSSISNRESTLKIVRYVVLFFR